MCFVLRQINWGKIAGQFCGFYTIMRDDGRWTEYVSLNINTKS